MRLCLGACVLATLVAAVAAAAAAADKPWASDNRVPDEKAAPGPQPSAYRYVSVCVNGTLDKGLYTAEGAKACDDYHQQVAVGRYANRVNETGWGVLEVETFATESDEVQAYAAGVAEAELTRLQIYYHYRNTIQSLCVGYRKYCKDLYKYLTTHLDWVRSQVVENEKKPTPDPYWHHVKLVYTQMTGLYESYVKKTNLTPQVGFDLHPIYMIQLSGELFDVNKWLNKKPDPQEYPEAGKCSGLVKLAPGNKDLFFSHVAMSSLATMNRVLKLYKFAYDKSAVPGRQVSFSGYAGALSSADDYTLTSAGLASIETTHAIFNATLYQLYIKPEGQVHCWVRSFIANALAKTSKEWVDIFGKYNSGTYNNQWVVVDYKKFTPGKDLPPTDVVWISEQVPGDYETEDVTWFLKEYSYFPSYNIPYIRRISQITGFAAKATQFDWYKWGGSPRARIFDRDHHKVVDIDSLTALMRYNDYKHDEFARCKCTPDPYTGEGGISARGDLNAVNGTYEVDSMGFRDHAGLDYKGTNYEMATKLRFRAWGGPPYNENVPAFDWRTTNVKARHFGQPDLWNFTYIDLVWEANVGMDLQ